jgi:hypothetical protein
MLSFLDFWSSPNHLGLVELASIMAEFTAAIVTETQYILKLTLELELTSFKCLLLGCSYIVRPEISVTLLLGHLSILSQLTCITSIEKFSVLMKTYDISFARDNYNWEYTTKEGLKT